MAMGYCSLVGWLRFCNRFDGHYRNFCGSSVAVFQINVKPGEEIMATISMYQERYDTLLEIVRDYLKHADLLNEKRIKYAEREVNFAMEEVKIFNLLMDNVIKIEAKYQHLNEE